MTFITGRWAIYYDSVAFSFFFQLMLQHSFQKTTPYRISRGSTAADDFFAYFATHNSTSVYQYEYSTEKWKELPSSPYRDSALIIFNGQLTAVGGSDGYRRTSKLFTLKQRKWVEQYPAMSSAHSRPAVAVTPDGHYLIMIGGAIGSCRWTATVKLFQKKTRRWYKLKDLPRPINTPSAVICGDLIYVIGADTGYFGSLEAVQSGDSLIMSGMLLNLISWKSIAHLPVTSPTPANLNGELIIVGGSRDFSSVSCIYQLLDGYWVQVGSMAICRKGCLVASLSFNKIIVVGGHEAQDSIEVFVKV